MAQKRMLNKSISISVQVASMSLKSQFIFTWCIPHLDDSGLIDKNPDVIKAMVFPMTKSISKKDVENFIKEATTYKLVKEYEDCIEFTGFNNHQSLSPEKRSKSKFLQVPKNPQNSPEFPKKSPYRLGKGRLGKDNPDATGREGFDPLGAEIIKAFEAVDPKNKNYYGHKAQRQACDFILREYGLDEAIKHIQVLPETNKLSYFPTVTTPVQLRDKWVQLESAVERKRGELKAKKPLVI